MADQLSTRRDTLKIGGAVAVALAAGTLLAGQASAQDATPAAGGNITSIQTVTLDAATRLIEAGQLKAMEIGVPMAIAIVDSVGLLKAFARMDGLDRAVTVDLVQAKAYTSASFRAATHMLAENAAADAAFLASVAAIPGFTLIGGGYPIMDGEMVVGGIGAGGGSPDQDMDVAEAALAALAG